GQASALADALRSAGLEPVLVPTIEIVPPVSFESLDAVVGKLDRFEWVVFTSANAVEVFAARCSRRVGLPKVAAIGAATARALVAAGFVVELVPEVAVAESLAEALVAVGAKRVAIVRAEVARDVLVARLEEAGAQVEIGVAYRNVVPKGSADRLRLFATEGWPAAVTFTSASTVRNLVALLAEAGVVLPEGVKRVSIGPVTSAAMRELGIPAHAEAKEAGIAALVDAVKECFRG
ncbi:MAG: uroporphyrinogen-III synthase, partial [Bryocella sp.]